MSARYSPTKSQWAVEPHAECCERAYLRWRLEELEWLASRLHLASAGACSMACLVRFLLIGTTHFVALAWLPLFCVFGVALSSTRVKSLLRTLPFNAACLAVHGLPSLFLFSLLFLTFRHRLYKGDDQLVFEHRVVCIEFSLWLCVSQLIGHKTHTEFLQVRLPMIVLKWVLMQISMDEAFDMHSAMIGLMLGMAVWHAAHAQDVQTRNYFEPVHNSRQLVAATSMLDASMRAMIGCLFQASCICDTGGRMTQSSDAFESILGEHVSDGTRSMLNVFDQPDRVLGFLKSVSKSNSVRAMSLPVTVRPFTSKSSFEATIYCMKLQEDDTLFVGMTTDLDNSSGHIVSYNFAPTRKDTVREDAACPTYTSWREAQSKIQFVPFAEFVGGASVFVTLVMCACVTVSTSSNFRLSFSVAFVCLVSSFGIGTFRGNMYNKFSRDLHQIMMCCCLHGLALQLSLSLPLLVSQHRCFIAVHIFMCYNCSCLVDLSPWRYLLVLPVQFLCWCMFHFLVNFRTPPAFVPGIACIFVSAFIRWNAEIRTWNTYHALEKERLLRSHVDSHVQILERMRDSLFDGSCLCKLSDHAVFSTTSHFTNSVGSNLSGIPLESLGTDVAAKMDLHNLLREVEEASSFVAKSTLVPVEVDGVVGHHARLFVVMQPLLGAHGLVESFALFVGLQKRDEVDLLKTVPECEDLSTISTCIGMSGDSGIPSISPSDSVSVWKGPYTISKEKLVSRKAMSSSRSI